MTLKILDLLLSREGKFFDYMARQVGILAEACRLFDESLACLGGAGAGEQKGYFGLIKDCEVRGDTLEKEILDKLRETFITPIDREDIHDIVTEVDTALDILNGTARMMEVYAVKSIPADVKALSRIVLQIVAELGELVAALSEKRPIAAGISSMHKLENDADELFHHCMLELFSDGYSAVEIVKMKEIYERLEGVIDTVDHVGKRIRGVRVKNG
jgi:uncharacterized protein